MTENERRIWTHEETVDFIHLAKEERLVAESDSTRNRNADIFRVLKDKMAERGHIFTVQNLRRKWRALKETYNKHANDLKTSGHSSKGLAWTYFKSMHEILGGRPRGIALQPEFGIESGREQSQVDSQHDTTDDLQVTVILTQENQDAVNSITEPASTQETVTATPATDCENVDVASPATVAEPSMSRRVIHGQSNSAKRRRSSSHPYDRGDMSSVLRMINEANDRQMNFLKESEGRQLQQSVNIDNTLNSALQNIGNLANALVSYLQQHNTQ